MAFAATTNVLPSFAGDERELPRLDEARSFDHHSGRIVALRFSPDGSRLAIAAPYDQVVTILDTKDMSRFRECHHSQVYGVRFSPDGKRLAMAGHDVVVWDIARRSIYLMPSDTLGASYENPLFLNAGNTLLASRLLYEDKRQISQWNVRKRIAQRCSSVSTNELLTMDVSADGKYLVVGDMAGNIQVRDCVRDEVIQSLRDGNGERKNGTVPWGGYSDDYVAHLRITPTGGVIVALAIVRGEASLSVWKRSARNRWRRLDVGAKSIGVSISHESKIASASSGLGVLTNSIRGRASFVDFVSGRRLARIEQVDPTPAGTLVDVFAVPWGVEAVAISADSSLIAIGDSFGRIVLYETPKSLRGPVP